MNSDTPSAALPRQIGRYRITARQGRGGMGVVYRGFDPEIDRSVAIKVLRNDLTGGVESAEQMLARFRNEARAVGRINHPGVVTVYELGSHEGQAFIAMEWVQGRDLGSVLADVPEPHEALTLSLMDQLLDALDGAHREGVWHRDIKPSNLLLTDNGQLKVTDFGLARIERASLTHGALMFGSPGHMAPEQYTGDTIGPRTDVFAAGVLLYTLLAGQRPFLGTPEQIMYQVFNVSPPPPGSGARRQRLARYDAVLSRAMALDASARFASAAAFRDALRAASQSEPGGDTQAPLPPLRLRPPAPPAHSGEGGHARTVALWDGATLSHVERALAGHVGPMARWVVRDAARSHSDLPSLAADVARHIDAAPARAAFLQQMMQAGMTASAGTRARALAAQVDTVPQTTSPRVGAGPAQAARREAITPAWLDKVAAAALPHIGPIAPVLVRRTAEGCSTRAQVLSRLGQSCPELDSDWQFRHLRDAD